MSAIGNNIAWHTNKETPSVPESNVVLSSFSIAIRGRYDDADEPVPSRTILQSMSVGIRSRFKDADQPQSSDVVIRSMCAGYIGYPYQGTSRPYTPPSGSYDLIHHK